MLHPPTLFRRVLTRAAVGVGTGAAAVFLLWVLGVYDGSEGLGVAARTGFVAGLAGVGQALLLQYGERDLS